MLKPDNESFYRVIEACKDYKIPVVVDYDDDIFSVPPHNPYVMDMAKDKNDYMGWTYACIKIADHVIVSTQCIKDKFQSMDLNKNITVIQNCFDDYCFEPAKELSKKKIVLWRGGRSHNKDLMLFKDQITKLIIENQDYTFIFWNSDGINPGWLENLKSEQQNIHFEDPVNPFYYFSYLKEMNPFLTIVPLEDNEFNHGKSDLAKIEAVASGGLCLSPNWEIWKWNSDGLYLYDKPTMFYAKADAILNAGRETEYRTGLQFNWFDDMEYLKKNKLLSKNNIKRLEVFKNVLNK